MVAGSAASPADIHAYLAGSDRRSIGASNQIVKRLQRQPGLFPTLIRHMWSDDATVAMRAADAAEKFTRTRPHKLQPFKKELIGLAEETPQHELRWHLAAMLPRLSLNPRELRQTVRVLNDCLRDKSSIVKTFAIQGLFDLAVNHRVLRSEVEELLASAARNGTAAMRARSRKLMVRAAKEW